MYGAKLNHTMSIFGMRPILHTYKTKLKITQLEKVHFVKVNELKLIEVELFQFFHFMCVAADASELFCVTHLASNEHFLYHSNLSF